MMHLDLLRIANALPDLEMSGGRGSSSTCECARTGAANVVACQMIVIRSGKAACFG
jgi:hypothetical protein